MPCGASCSGSGRRRCCSCCCSTSPCISLSATGWMPATASSAWPGSAGRRSVPVVNPIHMGWRNAAACGSVAVPWDRPDPRVPSVRQPLNRSAMSFRRSGPARALLLLFLALAGCSSADTQHASHMEQLGFRNPESVDPKSLFRRIGAEPTNARLHYDNGVYLLARGRYSDLEVARVAFANASRLAPDWWLPEVGLGITEYRLGRYDAALAAFAEAAGRRGNCDGLCYGLALTAYRA